MRIVPAKKRHLCPGRFFDGIIKIGDTFHTDSGMGGSWAVEYTGRNRHGQLVFVRRERPGWPRAHFRYDDHAHAARELYELVPEGEH
jgi:hypothetical protein